jgi:hypothetical protein
MGTEFRIAEGIGVSFMGGDLFIGKQYELIYARVNGTEYFPVELRSFSASLLQDNSVILHWVTENEIQNLGFTVQRSDDDEHAVWTNLSFIASAVEEAHGGEYSFIDHIAANCSGSIIYYRLKQHDYDGTTSYSPVVEVRLVQPAGLPNVRLYPNPVHAGTSVNIEIQGGHTGDLQLYDVFGRRVQTLPLTDRATIPTEGLTPGVYFLRLEQDASVSIEKLLIQ